MADVPEETWYLAILVYESRVTPFHPDDVAKVDVQYRLVRAADAETAHERALALGRRGQLDYENDEGGRCEWVFAGLQDLRRLDDQDLGHGAEVYGFIEDGAAADRVVDKDELTEFLGRRADNDDDDACD